MYSYPFLRNLQVRQITVLNRKGEFDAIGCCRTPITVSLCPISSTINIMPKIILIFSVVLFLLQISEFKVLPLDEEIGQAIFHQNEHYIIYVCEEPNTQALAALEEFCTEDKLCALLDSSIDMYVLMTSFVGMRASQYLLILNSQKYQKYTLPVDDSLTVYDILEFQSAFKTGTLEPHYTSEDLPEKSNDPYLLKIVGLNFQDFIQGSASIKVLFLYSDDQGCSTCKQVYDYVVQAAKKYPNREEVAFGALDLFRNDHKLLNEREIPVVLVYTNSQDYIRLKDIQQIKNLPQAIGQNIGRVYDL